METNVKVAVRCRPMSTKEINRNCTCIVNMTWDNGRHSVKVKPPPNIDNKEAGAMDAKEFAFDKCYFTESLQSDVYKDLGEPIVDQAIEGYNGTLFAYGQTGSGKTFSMMGVPEDVNLCGIIPRINADLFNKITGKQKLSPDTKFLVTVTFLEIYNEIIKDLLFPSDKQLKIRESPELGIYVEDLCELVVHNANDVNRLIEQGNTVRKVASTNMNEQSSRSHSCFTMKIEQKTVTDLGGGVQKEVIVRAKLNLVDLAGSERANKTGAKGSVLKEGANINLSLMALGNVINALSEGGSAGKKHIPYRDSKLTRLLQESLGGNANTVMLAAISPADYNFDETISTLKYAHRAKSIENAVSKNEDMQEKMIKDLKSQIEQLKAQLAHGGGAVGGVSSAEQLEMQDRLKKMEDDQRTSWEERERLSKMLAEERNKNVNNVIDNMMQNVKDKKVTHMKNIKRLMITKTEVTEKQKSLKDKNTETKARLDANMERYTQLQAEFDRVGKLVPPGQPNPESDEIAAQMVSLIKEIEHDRADWLEKREVLKELKERLTQIEDEITDERAELVATSGILDSNDKLRQQVQEEERAKAQQLIEAEIAAAKAQLALEKETVRGSIEAEIKEQMTELQSKVKELTSKLEFASKENERLSVGNADLQKYVETLENRATDAEVTAEESAMRISTLESENSALRSECEKLSQFESSYRDNVENISKDFEETLKSEEQKWKTKAEEESFQLFKKLLDSFDKERFEFNKRHDEVQAMLRQATQDLMFLVDENDELKRALQQAIHFEPPIE